VSSPLAGAGSSAGGGSGAGRAAHNPGHGHGHDDEPNLLPLHEPPALVMPSRVDADLVGKSDVVIAKVMARREDERRKEQERIAAVRQAELDQQRAEMAKDSLRATLGPKIKDWAEVRHARAAPACKLRWCASLVPCVVGCAEQRHEKGHSRAAVHSAKRVVGGLGLEPDANFRAHYGALL
jgi:hypothetical protein